MGAMVSADRNIGEYAMGLDPRGQRFAAALTSLVLVTVLATGWGWLALTQAAIFAVGAAAPARTPYALLFKALVAPRLGPPTDREDPRPVRFAQTVGLAFLTVAAAGYLTDRPTLGITFTALGLIAAFLNAAFGLCLGCEAYLTLRRLTAKP
jgi:hypothetical protein